MAIDRLFVYGTLRRGSDNQYARLLAERGTFVSTATVPGRVYDFGPYPGAAASDGPNEQVHGEVLQFDDPQLLPLLDEYEGEEYVRTRVAAQLESGDVVECWIYWYTSIPRGRLIESGDWFRR